MHHIIPMQTLLGKITKLTKLKTQKATVHSTTFKDIKGCIELVAALKMRPHTMHKHIASKYHHFREHVLREDIQVQRIDTKSQLADIFTKSWAEPLFRSLREQLPVLGW